MSCCVISCQSAKWRNEPGVTFHRFPTSNSRRRVWICAVGRKNWCPSTSAIICSKHFRLSDFEIKPSSKVALKRTATPYPCKPKISNHVEPTLLRQNIEYLQSQFNTNCVNMMDSSRQNELVDVPQGTSNDPLLKITFSGPQVPLNCVKGKSVTSTAKDIHLVKYVKSSSITQTVSNDSCSSTSVSSTDTFPLPTIIPDSISTQNTVIAAQGSIVPDKILQSTCDTNLSAQKTDKLGLNNFKASSNALQKEAVIYSNSSSETTSKPGPKYSKPSYKEAKIFGRRIVEIDYFLRMLKILNQHSTSGCDLNDCIITKEQQAGLSSSFFFKCTVCDYQIIIWSESPCNKYSINTHTIASMMSINCDMEHMNKVLVQMGLCGISDGIYTREYNKISARIQERNQIMEQNSRYVMVQSDTSKKLGENLKLEPETVTLQTSSLPEELASNNLESIYMLNPQPISENIASFESDNSGNVNHVNLDESSIQIVVKREITDAEFEDESESIMPQQMVIEISDDKMVDDQEQVFNVSRVKQEITCSETDEMENEDETGDMIPQQMVMITPDDKMVVDQEQLALNMVRIKQKISSPKANEMEAKESFIGCDNQTRTLFQQEYVGTCENLMFSSQEQIQMGETVIIQNMPNNRLVSEEITLTESKTLKEGDLNDSLLEDQFEIADENSCNEFKYDSEGIRTLQALSKESFIGYDNQTRTLFQQEYVGTCENSMFSSQEQIQMGETVVIQNMPNNRLVSEEITLTESKTLKEGDLNDSLLEDQFEIADENSCNEYEFKYDSEGIRTQQALFTISNVKTAAEEESVNMLNFDREIT